MSKGNIKILIGILCLLVMVFAAAGRYVGSFDTPEIIETEIGRLWYFFPEWEYRELSKIYGYGKTGETVFEN